jgi:YHS domain-containing protein
VLGIVLILALLRALVQWVYFRMNAAGRPASGDAAALETRRDPVCGAFVSPSHSLKATVRGEDQFFCSPACRDKYLAA